MPRVSSLVSCPQSLYIWGIFELKENGSDHVISSPNYYDKILIDIVCNIYKEAVEPRVLNGQCCHFSKSCTEITTASLF